jgi:hypothetical protein
MRKSTTKPRRTKAPKRVLALPDLEQSKAAVLNSLTSSSGQRTYDHAIQEFVTWYCSEPRLAFNRTVVLRYRIHLEQRHYAPATINLRLAAPSRPRGGRCRSAQPRTRGRHSPGQRCPPARCPPGELAHAGTGAATLDPAKADHAARIPQSRDARRTPRVRPSTGGTAGAAGRMDSAA